MGLMTLARFQAHITANPAIQGLTGIDLELVRDWVNMGYFELIGAVEFDALKKCASLTTVQDVRSYKLPTRFIDLIGLQDRSSGTFITKTNLRNLQRLSSNETGYPRFWTRKEDALVLWPLPDDEYDMFVYYVAEPLPLTASTDVTILSSTWDKAILLFALESALRENNQFDAADKVFTRVMANIKSRIKDGELGDSEEGPLNLVHSWDEVSNLKPDQRV